MEALMHKIFDQKLGEFLKVDPENLVCNISGGIISLRNAEVRAEVFDGVHLPITLRGGYIDEMSFKFDVGMFTAGGAKATIKNCFFVFGPQDCDWSWDTVHECKTKLVDLIMKVYSLKPLNKKKKKKKAGAPKGGWLAEMQQAMMENFVQKFLGLLEVQVQNIHFRYEDATTQKVPLACGFKIGSCQVNSDAKQKDLRTTGKWSGSSRDLLQQLEKDLTWFCQSIHTRRISAYWDVGKSVQINGPTGGKEVYEMFCRLNRREIFSTAVVDHVLSLYPPDHKRRKLLEGPAFRERLDFHQFVVFPSGLSAHIAVNRQCDSTRKQLAPLKDANVIVEPLEVAIDTEQVRSINELLTYVLGFLSKEKRFRTRPQEQIRKYLPTGELQRLQPGPDASSEGMLPKRQGSKLKAWQLVEGSTSSRNPRSFGSRDERSLRDDSSPDAQARKRLVRQWWQHAFHAVRLTCKISNSHLTAEELRQKCKLREKFVSLCIQEMDEEAGAAAGEQAGGSPSRSSTAPGPTTTELRLMQMSLPLKEIIDWRTLARQRRHDRDHPSAEDEESAVDEKALEEMEKLQKIPNTLQARIQFRGFQAHFLICANKAWSIASMRASSGDAADAKSGKSISDLRKVATRQLVVKGEVLDVNIEAVQKGKSNHRVGRWVELSVGKVGVTNCNVKNPEHAARQILNINPFESNKGSPVCMFLGVNMIEQFDDKVNPDDIPLTSALEPWGGAATHLQHVTGQEEKAKLDRLGFLKEYVDKEGKMMTFVFARCGQVRALDHTPFRRRLMHFLKRGMGSSSNDLLRRPSPLALDREVLATLQRRVQLLTGKSYSLGIVEGVIDGVRARMVDHYNSQHVLCKEVSLAPLRCKALHNGNPQTFHMQFHQLLQSQEHQRQISFPASSRSGDTFGLLPWKVGMLLLPRADFMMGLDNAEAPEREHPQEEARQRTEREAREAPSGHVDSVDPATAVLMGTVFSKWGKNGKTHRRFVYFSEEYDAIIWKKSESDTGVIGVIPLSSVQDISTGLQTPVLQKARSHSKLQPDRLLSVIAGDRTLDLQADSSEQQQRWVKGLKERYRMSVQTLDVDGGAVRALPQSLARKATQKSYPEKFRSDRCALRSTFRKVQAVTALGRSLKSVGTGEMQSQGGTSERLGSANQLPSQQSQIGSEQATV